MSQSENKSYKAMLNLPKTNFPMKGDLPKKEPIFIEKWYKNNLYKKIRDKYKGKTKFILHDGPPYANGDIHLGHAVNKVLKDIISKAQLLFDKDSIYVPGWDCHGLPIEHKIEEKYGRVNKKLDANEFRDKCREYAEKFIERQKKDFIRLGVIGDWEKPYKTMDFQVEADSVRTLSKIIQKGYFIRGEKPVHWCFDCQSALAEAEVEYRDKLSDSIYVAFDLLNINKFNSISGLKLDNLSLIAWTTTPWTLPGNQALSLHSDYDYAVINVKIKQDELPKNYLVLETRLKDLMEEFNYDDFEKIYTIKGSLLQNLSVKHCHEERGVKILVGDHVDDDTGTGIVHTAGSHGVDDFLICKKNNQEPRKVISTNGVYFDDVPLVGGYHLNKVNDIIIGYLKDKKTLVKHNKLTHSYPHCWRHKSPLIFQATPQYFIHLSHPELNSKIFAAIDSVNWMPSWGKERMQGMVGNRPDWCISRQRTWGTPIAIIVNRKTFDFHPELERLMEEVAKKIEKGGINAWFNLSLSELGVDENKYMKILDVLDVWFDSGSTHLSVLNSRIDLHGDTDEFLPADIYLEGGDQYRGWFQSSLLTSTIINGVSPYKAILSHGMTVDGKGQKMSKSIGNVISPKQITDKYGADILRLWIAILDYKKEMPISDEILKHVVDVYRRIRNTARYLLANLDKFDPGTSIVSYENLVEIDLWVLEEGYNTESKLKNLFHHHKYTEVISLVHEFCSKTLGSIYLDILKDRQYTLAEKSLSRKSAQSSMYHLVNMMTRWIMPILSFTAEEIYSYIPGDKEDSVFLTTWYYQSEEIKEIKKRTDKEIWSKLMLIKEVVNKSIEEKRQTEEIGGSLEVKVDLTLDESSFNLLEPMMDELKFFLIVSQLCCKSEKN